jgi:P4 family phage/plasmid primase-like protien
MDQGMNLPKFLSANTTTTQFTHTGLKGGKYWIPEDKIDQFYDLYSEWILDGKLVHLVEKNTKIGSLRIDFDFIYEPSVKTHQHTQEQVVAFCKAYMKEVSDYLQIPENVELFVMEKRKPTFDEKHNRMKSGIHIVVPQICTTTNVEQSIRRNLLKSMDTYFPNLPLSEKWDKVYDEAVVKRSVNWMLYGSRKGDEESLPYLISYIVNYSKSNGNISISNEIPRISKELIKNLSVRKQETDETQLTQKAKEIYDAGQNEPLISGGRAVTPARGRPAQRTDKPNSRGSSPIGRPIRPMDPEYKDYLKAHVMNLSMDRATKYEEWLKVGFCLHNIHPDLLEVFLDFSSQNEEKYNEADCIQKWNSITFRNDGDRVGIGSLYHWSRTDNSAGFLEIERMNVDRLVKQACSGTEHDVARVVNAMYRDLYKCTDYGKNVWYRWMGHIWAETDCGIDLQIRLSCEIAEVFFKKTNAVSRDMEQRNLMRCTSIETKTDCGACDYCQLNKSREGLNKIYTKLKTTTFKNNIMKECRELFFDEQFTKKVDSNKDIIAFNNGILDLTTFEFRDGRPDDYVSFSTQVDYDQDKNYYEYSEWPQIELFLSQVLPDPEVRSYFMKHLSTCLIGGNKAQKFHILTGSGSNGKSMLMNLASKALGDYAAVVPIALFTQKRAGSGNAAPEVIRLKGRRFVTMQEPDEKVALNTGLMKLVSSGEKMYARDLFKSGCEFEVQAKFHLACNDKPEINSTDGGTWRRLMVINFTSKFIDSPKDSNEFLIDETIQYMVNSQEWATPFLSYMIHTLKEGKGFHKLQAPTKVMEYTSDYRNDNDGIARFLNEKIAKTDDDDEPSLITKDILRSVFKIWKIQNELTSLSITDLEKRIIEKFGKSPRGGWLNFKIVE